MPGSSLLLRSCMAAEIRRGTLERVPRTPQNFPERIIAAVTRRSRPVPRTSPPPTGRHLPAHLQCRAGTATGVPGAKPPAELTYSLPLPRRGRGLGGMGAEKQANGKVDRQPPGQTHRRGIASSCIQCRPGKPLSNTTSPPTSSAASRPAPGMQGAKPLA